jgi:hypothetical protein
VDEFERVCIFSIGFSGHDPHRIMHMRGLEEGPVWLAEVASIHGRSVSMQPAAISLHTAIAVVC